MEYDAVKYSWVVPKTSEELKTISDGDDWDTQIMDLPVHEGNELLVYKVKDLEERIKDLKYRLDIKDAHPS